MIKMITPRGGTAYIASDRLDEYKAAGYTPAADFNKEGKNGTVRNHRRRAKPHATDDK